MGCWLTQPTFFSTAGSPPFIPDALTPEDTNEYVWAVSSAVVGSDTFYRPYTDWLDFVLGQPHLPLAISTSYGDDEQTGMCSSGLSVIVVSNWTIVPKSFAERACAGFAQLGAVIFPLFWTIYWKYGLQVLAASPLCSLLETVVWEMATQTLPLNNVSAMMAVMWPNSFQLFRLRAWSLCSCQWWLLSDTFIQPDVHCKCFIYEKALLSNTLDSVTTVGATTSVPEVAVFRFFSGGGFSNYVSCRWLEADQPYDQPKSILVYSACLPASCCRPLFRFSS